MDSNKDTLDFAPVSAVPVAGFVKVLPGHFYQIDGNWYYQESDSKPMEYLCPADGRPDTGDFIQRDGSWYYQLDDNAPMEYIGPVNGRAVII